MTVVGQRADVLTQTAQVATNFKQDLIASLPTNRDINAYLLLAPAVHPSGPNGAYSIAGSASFDNLFLVNGVTVNENLRGQANDLYIEDAIQETTVATAGISAEYGRFSGGVVNVVTKSGGNSFSGSFRETLINDKWRTLTPFERPAIASDPAHKELRVDNDRADPRVHPRRSDPQGSAVVLHVRPNADADGRSAARRAPTSRIPTSGRPSGTRARAPTR